MVFPHSNSMYSNSNEATLCTQSKHIYPHTAPLTSEALSWLALSPPDMWSLPFCCDIIPDSTYARESFSAWVCILTLLVQVVTLTSKLWDLTQAYIQMKLLIVSMRPQLMSKTEQCLLLFYMCWLNGMLYTSLSFRCQISGSIPELKTQPIWRPS